MLAGNAVKTTENRFRQSH